MDGFITWLVIFGIVFLAFIILRFIQPLFIYTIRQAIRKLEVTVAANISLDENLEIDASEAEKNYYKALLKDTRSESLRFDDSYVTIRIGKVREMYFLMSELSEGKDYQNCVLELADLLGNISGNIIVDKDNNYPLTFANEILDFLRTKRIEKENLAIVANQSLEEWYKLNPISIEQTIEIVIAVINALKVREN